MIKRLISFFLVLALSFSLSLSVFAVDDIYYYSLPPVVPSDPSLSNSYLVNSSVSGDGWNDSDRNLLQAIKNAITDISSGSINWYLTMIYDLLRGDIRSSLSSIDRNTSVSASRILDSNTLLGSINDSVSGLDGFATENTLSGFDSYFRDFLSYDDSISTSLSLGHRFKYKDYRGGDYFVSLPYLLYTMERTLVWDGNLTTGVPTIYRMLHLLQDTLASEDDRQLAENYKENREEAEKDFLNGQSGPTSLGKGDFSNASQVGGVLNDTLHMGGASNVSDFVSGFGSAGEESLSWFSDTTSNNLDGVMAAGNSTSGVSAFSDDGETMVNVDPDPYNMSEIVDRYEWLEGVFG